MTLSTYDDHYQPPKYGGGAIATNDYLMLGTQLGVPALICFVVYIILCLRQLGIKNAESGMKTACRAGAAAMATEFWFDDGLFQLATAAVFWTLLELGSDRRMSPAD